MGVAHRVGGDEKAEGVGLRKVDCVGQRAGERHMAIERAVHIEPQLDAVGAHLTEGAGDMMEALGAERLAGSDQLEEWIFGVGMSLDPRVVVPELDSLFGDAQSVIDEGIAQPVCGKGLPDDDWSAEGRRVGEVERVRRS